MSDKQIEIFQSDNGQTEVAVHLTEETAWLSQAQMAKLFDKDVRTINEHVKNIYKESELAERSTIRKFRIARQEGKRQVQREIDYYNLDMAISVGYRVNSKKGTQFRIWATRRLREYLAQGYAIDQRRFDQNADELGQAISLLRKMASSSELATDTGRDLAEIVGRYTRSFLWLQRYDEGLPEEPEGQIGGSLPTAEQARKALADFKADLLARGEATQLFANECNDGVPSILGNLDQTVLGDPAYPTIESKAAHLLYFFVKNHPFTDGNKRSGAFLFVDFLHRNNRLLDMQGNACINDIGLAALTLLVAESAPEQKETIIRLIMNMLAREGK